MPAPDPATDSPSPGTVGAPLARLRGITKAYPGVLANDAIDLALERGRVHALLGENGAGKSTLVKVLYGLLAPDAGTIEWQGRAVVIDGPAAARELGIAMVFQHFSLFDSLSVLENVALGMNVDADATLAARLVDVSARYGLPLDPGRSVFTLSVGERQRIEIVRCLLQSPKLLIMDEPTSVLTPAEVEQLFVTLRRLAGEGLAVLYISHKLEEIRALCDTATILRGGRVVGSADPSAETARSLAAMMMGATADARVLAEAGFEPRQHGEGVTAGTQGLQPRLRLANLCLPGADDAIGLVDVSLALAPGEIVGIAGVAGNGQDELVAAISGETPLAEAGMLEIDGRAAGTTGAAERRRAGLCTVPEERLGHAAVPGMTLADNAFLTAHLREDLRIGPRIGGRTVGFTSRARARRFAARVIEAFDVRCNGPSSLASSLSGGNLQKFVVGREILQRPGVLVVAQPTWGVDAGAAAAIHAALAELAAGGSAVLVISQDLDELLMITRRIGALCAGRLSRLYPTAEVDARQVGVLMGGATDLAEVAA